MVDDVNIVCWNVNGLNAPLKRTRILDFLRRKKVSVALIQESHLKAGDVQRFQNGRFKLIAHSCAQTKTKGVLILVDRRLSLSVDQVGDDGLGRFVYCKVRLNNVKVALASIYAPNVDDAAFLSDVSYTLLEMCDGYHLVVGGDYNSVVDPALDRSSVVGGGSQSTSLLNTFIRDLNVVDLWRIQNPSARDYTFYSNRHKSYSRIDYIFISPSLLPSASSVVFLPILLSDHAPLLVGIHPTAVREKATRWRFNTTLLTNPAFLTYIKAELGTFLEINREGCGDPQILWEATKCSLRGSCISFSSGLAKERSRRFEELEGEITLLEHAQKQQITDDRSAQLASLKSEFRALSLSRAEFMFHRTRQKYYFDAERPSRLLALKLKESESKASIPAVRDPNGIVFTSPQSVNDTFRSFYVGLYKSEVKHDKSRCEAFLSGLRLPKISQADRELLDSPLNLEELHGALKSLQRGKSPGLDGLPPELYLELWEMIGPLVLDSFNTAISRGEFHRDQKVALISLLLKKGKDPLECASYRPISLISCDQKLLAKALAMRLEAVTDALIGLDQTGFMRGRLAADNVRRLLHVIDSTNDSHDSRAIFSLDAEKAFDRLEWGYMWAVLEQLGFGTTFVNMIRTLYGAPMAAVLTGKTISPTFQLERSTRQGCPLSPTLFTLALEPLAQAVRQSASISPVMLQDQPHHISLYADDILLYLENLTVSIPHVLELFSDFGSMSGYKINWSKSVLMPLNSAARFAQLPAHISISDSFVYLGINIQPTLPRIIKDNFESTLCRIKADIQRWDGLKMSLQGRTNIVKMNVLPRINFLFSMLPLSPPPKYFDNIHSMVTKFLWSGKRARIRLTTLQQPKRRGGLAVPDFKIYYLAFQLQALRNWIDADSKVPWRSIEAGLVSPIRLQDLLFSGVGRRNSVHRFGCIINNALKVWKAAERLLGDPIRFCSSTPLWNNFNLMSGNKPFRNQSWSSRGIHVIGDLYSSSGLFTFQQLRHNFVLPASSFFIYLQLRSALKAYGVPWQSPPRSHPMLDWIEPTPNARGCVSRIYQHLLNAIRKTLPVESQWTRELERSGYQPNWEVIWSNRDITSQNVAHQLIQYKVIHRAYATPYRRYQMKLQTHYDCQFCIIPTPGSFLHMFWECPVVANLWSHVNTTLSDLLHVQYAPDPCLCLLNDDSACPLSLVQKRMLFAGFTAAKKAIVKHWFEHDLHLAAFWLGALRNIVNLELTTARMNRARPNTVQSWRGMSMGLLEL